MTTKTDYNMEFYCIVWGYGLISEESDADDRLPYSGQVPMTGLQLLVVGRWKVIGRLVRKQLTLPHGYLLCL
jgi:hypothetical protein